MNNLDFRDSYSKNMLRNLFKMKETTFKIWLREIEPELFKIDKTYSKYSKILSPKAFKFLMGEYGFEYPAEINKMIQDYYMSLGINRNDSP